MKKSLSLTLFLSAVLMGELLAQPVITSPTINLQPPVPTRAHTMKADARNTRDGAGRRRPNAGVPGAGAILIF